MLRVLHVIPSVSPARGGPSEAVRQMIAACAGHELAIELATTDDDGPGRRSSPGDPGHALAGCPVHVFKRTCVPYTVSISLARWLQHEVARFDVVHVHALFSFSSTAAMLACRQARIAYIVRPLGTLSPYGIQHRRPLAKQCSLAMIERPLLARAAGIHCTSLQEEAEVRALGIRTRTHVIPLAVPLVPNENPAPPKTDHSTVVFLSRLDPKKNVEALIDAFGELSVHLDTLRLLIAGDGAQEYVSRLKARAQSIPGGDRVEWLGDVRGQRKAQLLNEATLFVLPSLAENFGIAVAEALSAGLPCVVSNAVAIAPDVESAGAGRSVAPDATSIAHAIKVLLKDPAQLKRMSSNARTLAEREYSINVLGSRLRTLYETAARRACG